MRTRGGYRSQLRVVVERKLSYVFNRIGHYDFSQINAVIKRVFLNLFDSVRYDYLRYGSVGRGDFVFVVIVLVDFYRPIRRIQTERVRAYIQNTFVVRNGYRSAESFIRDEHSVFDDEFAVYRKRKFCHYVGNFTRFFVGKLRGDDGRTFRKSDYRSSVVVDFSNIRSARFISYGIIIRNVPRLHIVCKGDLFARVARNRTAVLINEYSVARLAYLTCLRASRIRELRIEIRESRRFERFRFYIVHVVFGHKTYLDVVVRIVFGSRLTCRSFLYVYHNRGFFQIHLFGYGNRYSAGGNAYYLTFFYNRDIFVGRSPLKELQIIFSFVDVFVRRREILSKV